MKKRSLLYIGNKVSDHRNTATTIDVMVPLLEQEGYIVHSASAKENKMLRLLDMAFKTYMLRKKVDCVLIDTYSTQNFYYAVAVAKICRIFKIAYIPILHGGNLPQRIKTHQKLSRSLFRDARTNVAPSKFLLEKFTEAGYTNLTYIPNTIELSNYPFLLRKAPEARLLWVRSFAEIYNPLLALKVVKQFRENGKEVSLCMIGPEKDGSLEKCKTYAEAEKLPVKFTGKLSKKEWISISEGYDIFINTTNFDNTPVSVIEAMALGMPIVSTNVGGVPYLIDHGKNGILIPPNDVSAMVKAIEGIITNPEISLEMTKNARSKVEAFDWQKVKHSWQTLLNE